MNLTHWQWSQDQYHQVTDIAQWGHGEHTDRTSLRKTTNGTYKYGVEDEEPTNDYITTITLHNFTIKMGKGARTAAFLLEHLLECLYGIFQISTLLILKAIRFMPRQYVPTTKNPILFTSASKLAEKIRKREISSLDVVNSFIDRIKETNPILNFMVADRFPSALDEAKKTDLFLASTKMTEEELKESMPFLGVPFTVKESLAVEGMPHTSGVYTRENVIADKDSPVVEAMKKAGAIPLAVTNTPEVCCWWETYNPLHGRTQNPYDTTRSAGGSSGGEGAVISSAGSLFGLGSDFAGSIRVPAAFNGIFGHRPTSMTSSIEGHYPVPANDDLKQMLITGPLTRYAEDLRPIVKILTKNTLDLSPVDLKNLTVYYIEGIDMYLTTPVQDSIKAAVRKTAKHFQSLGANTKPLHLKGLKYAMLYWYATVKTDDGPQLGRELANHKGEISIPAEVCKTVIGTSKHSLPIILFGILESANGVTYKGRLHTAVLKLLEKLKEELKEKLTENSVLIMPTHPTTALKHGEAVARAMDLGYAAVVNVLGFPSTACPITRDERGMPVGIQVVANSYQDRLSLAVAEELERAFGGWSPPFGSH